MKIIDKEQIEIKSTRIKNS
ncbi:hypothetical protein [Borreliella bavariensis]|nr:hypothetical protein [Borreliella bavariensis]